MLTQRYVLDLSTEEAATLCSILKERIKAETDFLGKVRKNQAYRQRYPQIVKTSEYYLNIFSRVYNTLRGKERE